MILPTIYKYLKANATISDVRKRYDNDINPKSCQGLYLVVWEDSFIPSLNDNNSAGIRVSCHAPLGNDADVDKFILFELFELLDNKVLSFISGEEIIKFKCYVTSDMSSMTSLNNDESVSRDRLVQVPSRWR